MYPFGFIFTGMMLTTDKLKETRVLRAWVLFRLAEKGLTFTALADRYGAGRELPSKVFTSPHYPKWEKIIADAILMMPEEIWPERYKERADRKSKQLLRKAKSTRKERGAQ